MTYSYALGRLLPKLTLKIGIILLSCAATFAQVRPRGLDAYPEWQSQPITEKATTEAAITPLQIGDTIPAALWQLPLQVLNHPEGKETITLNDYRGKLILLDFWGPNCSYCIAAFPKLDSLQSQFNNDIQIVLATPRDHELIVKFHQHKPIPGQLFSTTADSVLPRVFPHLLVPHYAWVNREGTVVATTNGTAVTAENIRLALDGQLIQAVQKYDLDFTRPFFLAETETELPLHYALFRRGHYPGLNSQEKKHMTNGVVRGKSFANYTYRELYYLVARPIFEQKGIRLTPNRWRLHIRDTLNWMSTQEAKRLNPEMLHSYELVVPLEEAHILDSLLLNTLNNYSGYSASIRQIKAPCLVIKQVSPKATSAQKDHDQTLSQLVLRWNLSYLPNGKPRPILLDESDYQHLIPTGLRARDIPTLRQALASLGLELTETTRKLDMLVITQH